MLGNGGFSPLTPQVTDLLSSTTSLTTVAALTGTGVHAVLKDEDWETVNVLVNCGAPVKRNLQDIWPHLPNLEWLHSSAAGVEHILFDDLTNGPVVLTNAKVGAPLHFGRLGDQYGVPNHGHACTFTEGACFVGTLQLCSLSPDSQALGVCNS